MFVRICINIILGLLASCSLLAHAQEKGVFYDEIPISQQNVEGTSLNHTNNWAVLVSASRYWFNYRHMSNALGMYRTVKRLGIPDSNIILMLADDTACNARNHFPGAVYAGAGAKIDLYGDNIEVDYRGYEVTVENFIRLLTGRMDASVPRSKRLLTDARSNVFVYMTGHGGNEFLKFQDNEEISAFDIADAFEQMWQKKRYNELLFMIDTCQANTMYSKIYSPNVLATGSSELGENSYSYENSFDVGVAVIDGFTHHILQYMEGINKTSHASMQDLFSTYDYRTIKSHAGVRSDLFPRSLTETLITDFFGGVSQVGLVDSEIEAEIDPSAQSTASSPSYQDQANNSEINAQTSMSNPHKDSDRSHPSDVHVDHELRTTIQRSLDKRQEVRKAWPVRESAALLLVSALIGWVFISQ